jgi:hypothetical protein
MNGRYSKDCRRIGPVFTAIRWLIWMLRTCRVGNAKMAPMRLATGALETPLANP